ncbi:MAG: hypothetical protein ABI580_00070 [Burkholderiaceae bacterium]
MITSEPPVTVQEVSMQEWAMLAFHAARAPQRVRVTVKTAAAADDFATGSAGRAFWFLLAVAMVGMAWWLS